MVQFKDSDEVSEWLETLNYDQFWKEAEPFGMGSNYRANCDVSIARGVDKAMILKCVKSELRLKIIKAQDLKVRITKERASLH